MKNKFFKFWLAIAFCAGAVFLAMGNETLESSPWVGWRQGFQAYDQAEMYKMDSNYDQALLAYSRARDYFAAIQRYFPEWNSKVVKARVELCENQIGAMRLKIEQAGRKPLSERKAPEKSSRTPVARSGEERSKPAADTAGDMPSSRLYLEMQSELDQYRRRLRKALSEIDDLQVKLRQSEARSRDTESLLKENRQLQEKYAMLELQFKDLQSKNSSFDQERYQAQLVNLKHTNEEALKQIKLLENELKNKDQEYAVSRNEVLKQRNEVLTLTNEVRRLNREIEQLRSKAAEAARVKALTGQVAELENELKAKDLRIERLMKLLSQSANDGSTANTALNDEIKRLKAEVEQLRKSAGQESKLRRRISELTAAESELQTQMAELAETLRQRNIELQALKNDDLINRGKLEKSAREIKDLQTRSQALETEIKNITGRHAELEKRYQDRLRSDAASQEKLQNEKLQIEKNLNASVSELRKCRDELEKVRKEYEAADKMFKESRARLIELTAKVQSAEVELAKMNEVQKAYDELKARHEQLSQASDREIAAALNRVPALEATIKRSEEENKRLLAQNNALKQQLRKQEAALKQRASADKPRSAGVSTGVAEAPEPEEPAGAENEIPADIPEVVVSTAEEVENYLAEGRSASNRGNLEIAKWNFRQVLMRDPGNVDASALLGVICYREGRFAEAAELLSKVAPQLKDNEVLINALGRSLIGLRQYDEALKVIAELRELRNGRSSARMLLTEAVAWSRKGDNQKAEKAFKMVLELDGNNAEAPYELALMLSADPARLQEAAEFYRLARANGVEVDSYLEETLHSGKNNSSSCEFMLGNVRDALLNEDMVSAKWYFEEAEKIDKDNIEVILMRDIIALMDDRHGQVIDRLSKSSDLRQKFLLALALLRANRTDEAEALIVKMPQMLKTALPEELLKKFIRRQLEHAPAGTGKVYAQLLEKLP